jgi:hypothetical protein
MAIGGRMIKLVILKGFMASLGLYSVICCGLAKDVVVNSKVASKMIAAYFIVYILLFKINIQYKLFLFQGQ